MQKELILKQLGDLESAASLLRASVKKYSPFDTMHIYTPDELEPYDSLAFRFEKGVELTLNFFRSLEMYTAAKASDTLRDRLLVMHKINIIDGLDFWLEARLLRNKIAHAYLPEDIKEIYQEIKDKSSEFFATIEKIKKYLA